MLRRMAVIIIILAGCCNLLAATYWIAPEGQAAGAGTETNPFTSVETALNKSTGGDTLIFEPGVYIGKQITLTPKHAGTAQKPTVLKSQHKYEAVLHGSAVYNIYVKAGCNWVIIDGFESSGARYTGIKSDADYTVIRNCRIHNNALQGIEAHGVRGTVIENNLVEYNGEHVQFCHGIYADGENLTIRNNIIRYNSGWGLHLYPAIANSQIENNLIHANERWGIALYSKPKIGSNRIVNNTIVLNGNGIAVRNGRDEIIANNIIVDNTNWRFEKAEPIKILDGYSNKSRITIDYNLCLPRLRGAGPHGLSADPKFLDPKKGTFHLQKGSPAIAKGSAKSAPKRDFFNRPRPEGKAPDLGCFAYDPALLLPEAREDWYYQWPFLFKGKAKTMPDLWKQSE